jgi:hypothetical protein
MIVTLSFLSLAVLAGCGASDSGGGSSNDDGAPKLGEVGAVAGPCTEDGCLVSVLAYTDVDDYDKTKWALGLAGIKSKTPPKKCDMSQAIDVSNGPFISTAMDSETDYAFRVCVINLETGETVESKTTTVKTNALE